MSQIGRVFSILNVAFAAIFLFVAGTFLQQQDDFKKLYEQEQAARQKDSNTSTAQITSLEEEVNAKKSQISSLQTNLGRADTEVEDLKSDNKVLQDRLTVLESESRKMASSLATVTSSIDAASKLAADSQKQALDYFEQKNKAELAAAEATASDRDTKVALNAANNKIDQLVAQIGDLELRQKELEIVVINYAAIYGSNVGRQAPPFAGTVVAVRDDRLVTFAVSSELPDPNVMKNHQAAIYANGIYKGEVMVTDVDEANGRVQAFGRVLRRAADTPSIRVGDQVASQLSGL